MKTVLLSAKDVMEIMAALDDRNDLYLKDLAGLHRELNAVKRLDGTSTELPGLVIVHERMIAAIESQSTINRNLILTLDASVKVEVTCEFPDEFVELDAQGRIPAPTNVGN